jgi:hypothetical protein
MLRHLFLLLVSLFLALCAAAAARGSELGLMRTVGAEKVELLNGVGYASIARRGTLLARVGLGRIVVADLPGGAAPTVRCDRRGIRVSATTRSYRGAGVSCRISGGPWRTSLRGRNIDVSGVVRGNLALDGGSGWFRIDEGAWRRWPQVLRRYMLGLG